MLDDPEKTQHLLRALRAELPFEVRLAPTLARHLQSRLPTVVSSDRHLVRGISYAGDEGGIVCHLDAGNGQEVLVVSLTHLHVPASVSVAAEAAVYQKRRIKRLKKLGRA
jgi:hypothetical protein